MKKSKKKKLNTIKHHGILEWFELDNLANFGNQKSFKSYSVTFDDITIAELLENKGFSIKELEGILFDITISFQK